MNQEIKARWVAALRSGEYRQARGMLRDGDAFCCLGVLCDLHAKESGGEWDNDGEYHGADEILPADVVGWAGLIAPNPFAGNHYLGTWNDGTTDVQPQDFSAIAALIEEYL